MLGVYANSRTNSFCSCSTGCLGSGFNSFGNASTHFVTSRFCYSSCNSSGNSLSCFSGSSNQSFKCVSWSAFVVYDFRADCAHVHGHGRVVHYCCNNYDFSIYFSCFLSLIALRLGVRPVATPSPTSVACPAPLEAPEPAYNGSAYGASSRCPFEVPSSESVVST